MHYIGRPFARPVFARALVALFHFVAEKSAPPGLLSDFAMQKSHRTFLLFCAEVLVTQSTFALCSAEGKGDQISVIET